MAHHIGAWCLVQLICSFTKWTNYPSLNYHIPARPIIRASTSHNSNSTLFYYSKKPFYHYTISFYNTSSIPNLYFLILLIKIIYLHNKIIYPKTQIKTKTQITTCYHHHHEQPSTHHRSQTHQPINPSTTTAPIKPINPTKPSTPIKKTQIATQTSSFSHQSQKEKKNTHTHTQPRRIGSQPTSAALFDTRFSISAPTNSHSSLSSYSSRSLSRYPTAPSRRDHLVSQRDRLVSFRAPAICMDSTATTNRNQRCLVFGPCIGDGLKVW